MYVYAYIIFFRSLDVVLPYTLWSWLKKLNLHPKGSLIYICIPSGQMNVDRKMKECFCIFQCKNLISYCDPTVENHHVKKIEHTFDRDVIP